MEGKGTRGGGRELYQLPSTYPVPVPTGVRDLLPGLGSSTEQSPNLSSCNNITFNPSLQRSWGGGLEAACWGRG